MTTFLVRRSVQIASVMVIISVLTFLIINLSPGGPAMFLSLEYTTDQREAVIRSLGLDQPIHIRYVRWVISMVQGDMGIAFTDGTPVGSLIMNRLPNTVLLAVSALVVSVMMGIVLGVVSATRRYSVYDHAASLLSFVGVSIPTFWFGILLVLLFSVELSWLPTSGMASMGSGFSIVDRLQHLLLPTAVMSTVVLPQVVRFTRSSLLEVLQQDYIRTARAMGFSERVVVYRYGLKNSLFPVITIIGLLIPKLIGGSVITEQVFAWPGMGRLALTAALGRDYPLIMGLTVVVSLVVLITNLIIDVMYTYLDPRIRFDAGIDS